MEDSFAIIEQSTFWKCLAAKELEGKRMLNQCRGIKCARFVRGTQTEFRGWMSRRETVEEDQGETQGGRESTW